MKQREMVFTSVWQYPALYEARPYMILAFGAGALWYACKQNSFTCLVGSAVLISCACVIMNWRSQYRRAQK